MKKTTKILLTTAALLGLTSTAFAVPIVLPTDNILEIKYQNWENIYDAAGNKLAVGAPIVVGDTIRGIVNVSSVQSLSGKQTYSTSSSPYELTGAFQLSVIGGTGISGGAGNVQFGMTSTDYFNFYYDSAKNFDAQASGSTALATDGNLWLSVKGTDYINGIAVSQSTSQTDNYNWLNPTVNNTGYTFTPQIWPIGPLGEVVLDPNTGLPTNFLSDFYLEGKVNNLVAASSYKDGWLYKSEDPLYAVANPVPEPGTMVLLGFGLTGLAVAARRRKNNV